MTGGPVPPRGVPPRDPAGPTDLSLPSLAAAAGTSWRAAGAELTLRVLGAGVVWAGCGGLSGGVLGGCLSDGPPLALILILTPAWLLGVWAGACCLLHGLSAACLSVARGGSPVGLTFSAPDPGRAAGLGVPVILLQSVLKWTAVLLPAFFAPAEVRELAVVIGFVIGQAVPAVTFVLMWPATFLIVDRRNSGWAEPLIAAVVLPAGRRGGATAVGVLTYALLAGPLLLFDVLYLHVFGLTRIVGSLAGPDAIAILFWNALLLSVLTPLLCGPPAGLLLAHTYDRLARADAAAAREAAEALDPAAAD